MRNIYSTLLFAAAAVSFTACHISDEEYIFDESAAQRLNKAEAKYSQLLTHSPYGWAFEYYPTADADDGALLYAVKFNTDGTVEVAGDPTGSKVISTETSVWDIILDQGPVLSFSTYNSLIHRWSDPDISTYYPNASADGKGFEGDYEFSFVYDETENQDSVVTLRGKKRGLKSRLKMIDEDVTPEQYLLDIAAFQTTTFPESAPNYLLLHIGDSLMRVDDIASTTPDVYPFGKDPVFFAKTNSYITAKYDGSYSLRFNKPFVKADGTEAEYFVYNADEEVFYAKNDPTINITGPDANVFLYDRLSVGASITFTSAAVASQDFTGALAAIKKAFSDIKYTFTSIVFRHGDDGMRATVNYKNAKKQNVATIFNFEMKKNQDGAIVITYLAPANTTGETLLNAIPSISTFFSLLEGTYNVESTGSKFNLAKVKFADGEKYFIVSPTYPKSDDNVGDL